MNMNRKCLYFLISFLVLFLFNNNVYAEEIACNRWATEGEKVCESKTYKGNKCAWDGTKKGGSRCYDSKKLAEDKKEEMTETATSCKEIKDHETCSSSKIEGKECIWRQGACYNSFDDGTDETIIADDQDERDEKEADDMTVPTKPHKTTTLKHAYVGEGICGEEDVHKILKMVGYILIIAKVMVPLILIVIGTIDLYKAVIGKDEKDLTKSIKLLMLRIALGIFIFFIPTLVNLVIDSIKNPVGDKENNAQCISCVLDPINC